MIFAPLPILRLQLTINNMRPPHTFLNPLTIFLALAAAYLTVEQVAHVAVPRAAMAQAGQEARLMELRWAAAYKNEGGRGALLERLGKKIYVSLESLDAHGKPPKDAKNPWDVAVGSVLLAEAGKLKEAERLLDFAPKGLFRDCWEAAYASGPIPSSADIELATSSLSNGLAAKLLEGRIAEAQTSEWTTDARNGILAAYKKKAVALSVVAIILFVGAIWGLGIGIWALAKKPPLADPPRFQMPAVYALNVCLGWYVCFFLSSTLAGFIGKTAHLGVWTLPLNYSLHAVCGIAFICAAEKFSPLALWHKISKKDWRWPMNGVRFLLLALTLTLAASWLLSFVMPEGDQPQKELVELIGGSKGVLPILAVFGTVAFLGPMFEEIFFRGFMMSMFRRRLPVAGALLLSSALFASIHFDLQIIPLLAILGCTLGIAFMRTGDIKTTIFVHACWNGGVFLFQKLLMA
ncbi:MAG: CPBP family intramembrane metalloprotease [Holophagales bacterium]|jgi:membrane protease YdiL (CAAX protease family)|nr:CPBP family intramembrane metalloprotease [Holophagales bacterium]